MDTVDNIHVGLELEQSFQSVGLSMYSDDFACKILAYSYCFGGGNEEVVTNKKLHFAIRCAALKLNIRGGEIPNPKLLPLLQQRIQELAERGSRVEWLQEIKERYNVRIPDYDSLPEYKKINLSNA